MVEIRISSQYVGKEKVFEIYRRVNGTIELYSNSPRGQATESLRELLTQLPTASIVTDDLTPSEARHFLRVRPMDEEGLYQQWLQEHGKQNSDVEAIRQGSYFVAGVDFQQNSPIFRRYEAPVRPWHPNRVG